MGAIFPPTAAEGQLRATPPAPRWTVFVHQDGVLLCTTLWALDEIDVLERSLAAERSVSDLLPGLPEEGYGFLRVGLRCLAGQGWLAESAGVDSSAAVLRWTAAGRAALRHRRAYVAAGRLLSLFSSNDRYAWRRPWSAEQAAAFAALVPLACDRWRLGDDLPALARAAITTHLDAALVVPTMLSLRAGGLPDGDAGRAARRLLGALGWTDPDGDWTPAGREAERLAVHFGMAASYLPLLARLPALYRGEPGAQAATDADGEWHVNRALNVQASAAAHMRYFADADGIFTELFDREPIANQPRFVAEMGCGDGSWLVRLHRLISARTLRGTARGADELLMVGLDYNPGALDEARRVLAEADVPALLIHGDIGDPEGVRASLAEHGLRIEDGLHVRAFIDHDRTYRGGDPDTPVRGRSSGAYLDAAGRPLDGAAVERDLVAHLARWAAHVPRHGLVVLEAHCVAPLVARRHIGATHSVAFDAYHGYSHQYPIDHSSFLDCCEQAGLRPATHCERRYPATRPFVAVSLNRLFVPDAETTLPALDPGAPRHDTWRPAAGTDLSDGRALHELLYRRGDIRYPRLWCSAATGTVVNGALDAVEARLARAVPGDVVRVVDYGAGTGLATIELLKACHERGVDRRLESLGAALEVHLVDLPSSWFAQGFELLRDCAWTRFHSLRDHRGGFRPLDQVLVSRAVDVVMANMVFHLIPPPALDRAAADLAAVTAPGGRLVWSSPDLGPAGEYAVLFHDANRALRARWLDLLCGDRPANGSASGALARALRHARATFDGDALRAAQARADRRVLPQANAADDVVAALERRFPGEARLGLATHELLDEDVVDTLLVPSNGAEYLPEIADRELRERVIRDLMLGDVLPTLHAGPADTGGGLNVQWTLGAQTR